MRLRMLKEKMNREAGTMSSNNLSGISCITYLMRCKVQENDDEKSLKIDGGSGQKLGFEKEKVGWEYFELSQKGDRISVKSGPELGLENEKAGFGFFAGFRGYNGCNGGICCAGLENGSRVTNIG